MMRTGIVRGSAWAAVLTLSACAVGPQYEAPAVPTVTLASPQAAAFSADAAHAPADWWTLLDDPGLDQWVAMTLQQNHDLRQAQATWLAARAESDDRRLDQLPGVTAASTYQRESQLQAGADGESVRVLSESWRAGFDMQWELDLFGRLAHLTQAAQAQAQASQAAVAWVRLTLVAEVARAWVDLQALRRQLVLTQQEADSWQQTVAIAQASLAAGAGLPEDVENARANWQRTQALLPPLLATQQQTRFRLHVLAGQRPGATALPEPEGLAGELLIQHLPLADVDRLLRRRPDVVQAERQLAASVETVGAATADLYPRLQLGGFLGLFALRDGDLGRAAARAFDIAPGLSWPALRLGNARARLRGAEALSQGALARYEQTLLLAQEEVEAAVTGLATQQQRLAALLKAAGHAQTAFEIADTRYRAGAQNYQSVLENQRAVFALKREMIAAETASLHQLIALYKALGVTP